jgi:hypothetical protein
MQIIRPSLPLVKANVGVRGRSISVCDAVKIGMRDEVRGRVVGVGRAGCGFLAAPWSSPAGSPRGVLGGETTAAAMAFACFE